MSDPDVERLLERALSHDREALGELLEVHRGYLRVLAQRWIDDAVAARIDASDVVQQTFLSAFGKFDRFRGSDPAEFAAWLRAVHDGNVRDAIRRHVLAAKRTVAVEVRLDSPDVPRTDDSPGSPSQIALENERAVLVARALEQLPPEQREVVRLRYFEGWPLADIALRLERSRASVSGLLARGMRHMKSHLND